MRWKVLFFDLDGTLYHPEQGLWQAIGERIEAFLQQFFQVPPDQARALRYAYAQRYGTTLRGLQEEHGLNPWEYLNFINQVPVERYLRPDSRLRDLLISLPQRKWILTNADASYARRVLRALGIEDLFEGIIDIEALGWTPKPHREAFQQARRRAGVAHPRHALLVDDLVRNVQGALAVNMDAVLVHPRPPQEALPWIPDLYRLPHWMQERTRTQAPKQGV